MADIPCKVCKEPSRYMVGEATLIAGVFVLDEKRSAYYCEKHKPADFSSNFQAELSAEVRSSYLTLPKNIVNLF